MRLIALLCMGLVLFGPLHADTLQTLKYTDYLQQVKQHHPIAQRAQVVLGVTQAEVQVARGSFDPTANLDMGQKYFTDKQYYSLIDGALKIPTWYGVDVELGWTHNRGVFLNPENTVPNQGLLRATLSVPLGKGLFIDKRRAALRKAQVYQDIGENEARLILNDLMMDAGMAYWDWVEANALVDIYTEGVKVAQDRFVAVRRMSLLGDRPPIDTVEAQIQVQNRQFALQEATLKRQNSAAKLSVYLWANGVVPLELKVGTRPQQGILEAQIGSVNNQSLKDSLIRQHPEWLQAQLKVQISKIEQRFRREMLKPAFNLKYNPIADAGAADPISAFTRTNYTWGLGFKMPILLREERGRLKQANLGVQEAQWMQENKFQMLEAKVEVAFNKLRTYEQQRELLRRTTLNREKLLKGEKRLFDGGESSLFMVNSREVNYIKAQINWLHAKVERQRAALGVQYALALLPN